MEREWVFLFYDVEHFTPKECQNMPLQECLELHQLGSLLANPKFGVCAVVCSAVSFFTPSPIIQLMDTVQRLWAHRADFLCRGLTM